MTNSTPAAGARASLLSVSDVVPRGLLDTGIALSHGVLVEPLASSALALDFYSGPRRVLEVPVDRAHP